MDYKEKDLRESDAEQKTTVTRRTWLINIGKAAALAGIAGTSDPAEGDTLGQAGPREAARKSSSSLPPGLYGPSFDHLTQAMSSESRFHPIPPDSPTDFIRPRIGPYQPQFFSQNEYRVVHRLTALMLGETPASGSREIVDEVAEWVDFRTFSFGGARRAARQLTPEQRALAKAYNGAPLLRELETADPQKAYRDGLAWLAEESNRRHHHEFIDLTEDQQTSILDQISDARADLSVENDGTRFFNQLKRDVIDGFYTSQTGLKELDYKGNAFYAASPRCSSPDHPHTKTEP